MSSFSRSLGYSVLKKAYNAVLRERLPKKLCVKNGVVVRYAGLFDMTDHVECWKDGTVSAVQEMVSRGDRVIEVGGGFGVCTVWAARTAGEEGSVETYEAALNRVDIIKETVTLNGVEERVEVTHGVVGEAVDTFGELDGAEHVAADSLAQSDILVMDCEGAELGILESLEKAGKLPERVVVETHGFAGAETKAVSEFLSRNGYTILSNDIAALNAPPEDDNRVLSASRR